MKFDVELAKRSLADDPELALAARYWNATVVLKDDEVSYSIQFEKGKVVDFLEGAVEAATVTLTTSTENWDKMLEPIPVPFWTEPAAALFYRDGALEIAGDYEQDVQPIAPGGVLRPEITPVRQAELVNLLNPVQLAKFGLNLSTAPSDRFSLSEKWEALALAPVLDRNAPHDVFLLVGNDNDFETAAGRINGQAFDASLTNADGSGSGDNDSVILVYRLTLPTFPDRSN